MGSVILYAANSILTDKKFTIEIALGSIIELLVLVHMLLNNSPTMPGPGSVIVPIASWLISIIPLFIIRYGDSDVIQLD